MAAGAALATGGPAGPGDGHLPRRAAVVVDAPPALDREALAALRDRAARRLHAQVAVRAPRSPAEARTDLRYFAAQGYDVVVAAGPRARAAAVGLERGRKGPQIMVIPPPR